MNKFMCGIFGIASTGRQNLPFHEMTDTLSHRGPDQYGFFSDNHVSLGHRRLKIIDLEGGKQPVFNEDKTKCIVFNGEIYNYKRLRGELVEKGHGFTTRSDTEVILHAYEEWGDRCVDYLRGMFAFAIWDSKRKRLFLARDRLGIKPLFYAEHRGVFYFASEMKAILADNEVPRELDETAMAGYFTLSYIPAPLTIYRRIRKLLPGYILIWEDGKVRLKKYWDLFFVPERGKSERHFINGFTELFRDSVQMRLMSEVPLGAFLSGGIDSSAVVAMMTRGGSTAVNTFCIGFGGTTGAYLDERKYAHMVSEMYSTNHLESEVSPDPGRLLATIVRSFDEPFADDSTIPSYWVCKVARENVTVALSGLGGDEAFAGYERYLGYRLRGLYKRIPFLIRDKIVARLIEKLPERADGHYTVNHMKRFVRSGNLPADECYFSYMSILNKERGGLLFADKEKFVKNHEVCKHLVLDHFNSSMVEGGDDSFNRVLYCDLKTYLPDDILAVTDRMSMHHSLEVRVPFVDHKLLEFCATIPPEMKMRWGRKKYLLKKATKNMLPREVVTHRKQGFVGPMAQWLKHDMKSYVKEALSRENLERHGLLNYHGVNGILEEHFAGREIHDTLIWAILVFQKWYERYIENRSG